jgi:hypothetical protein
MPLPSNAVPVGGGVVVVVGGAGFRIRSQGELFVRAPRAPRT